MLAGAAAIILAAGLWAQPGPALTAHAQEPSPTSQTLGAVTPPTVFFGIACIDGQPAPYRTLVQGDEKQDNTEKGLYSNVSDFTIQVDTGQPGTEVRCLVHSGLDGSQLPSYDELWFT